MRQTNSYFKVDSEGQRRSDSVEADNRSQASALLHCPDEFVRFEKKVPRTLLQRKGDHCAKLPISLWRKR